MKTKIIISALLLVCLSMMAKAQSQYEQNSKQSPVDVKHLLEQQRSGVLASRTEQKLDGETRVNIYKRYVESFTTPIPEKFAEEGFGSSE